ncbi:hypothetical protein ACOMHN_013429 [Nucella lapillus]
MDDLEELSHTEHPLDIVCKLEIEDSAPSRSNHEPLQETEEAASGVASNHGLPNTTRSAQNSSHYQTFTSHHEVQETEPASAEV